MSEKLKPCPFCGSAPIKNENNLVRCFHCPTRWITIEHWNTRTADKEIADLKQQVLKYLGLLKGKDEEIKELKKQEQTLNKIIDSIRRCDRIKITTDTKVWLELQAENEKLKAEVAELKERHIRLAFIIDYAASMVSDKEHIQKYLIDSLATAEKPFDSEIISIEQENEKLKSKLSAIKENRKVDEKMIEDIIVKKTTGVSLVGGLKKVEFAVECATEIAEKLNKEE